MTYAAIPFFDFDSGVNGGVVTNGGGAPGAQTLQAEDGPALQAEDGNPILSE